MATMMVAARRATTRLMATARRARMMATARRVTTMTDYNDGDGDGDGAMGSLRFRHAAVDLGPAGGISASRGGPEVV
jgi:hypothetical protein